MNHLNLSYVEGKTPFEHQAIVLDQIIKHMEQYRGGAFLMDMGTGKSATAIHTARLLHRAEDYIDRMLIVCPKTLIPTWYNEDPDNPGQFQQHLEHVPATIIWDAQKATTRKWQERKEYIECVQGIAIGIINIEAFQNDNSRRDIFLDQFCRDHRTLCVLDESSYIKTPKAQRTKRLQKWRDRFTYRLILTGTDITKDVLDYYEQLRFMVPDIWKQFGIANYWAFRARYAVMREIPLQQGRTVKVVAGYQRVDELLQRIQPYIFRARKEDCLDLPDKTYVTIPVTMNASQKKIYEAFVAEMMAEYQGECLTETQAITVELRAQQLAGGFFPKNGESIGGNEKIKALIDDSRGTNEKTIVWATFKHEVYAIAEALREAHGSETVVIYTGDQSMEERQEAIARFKQDVRFFVATPQAGGFGLNLQFCTLQYWFSRSRRMDVNKQAEERSHRIGTQGTVVYKNFITQGTVDEKIYKRDRERRELLDGLQTQNLQKITDVLGITSIDKILIV